MEAPAVDAEITTLQVFSDESQSLYLSFPLFWFWPLLGTPITLCRSWWCIKVALLHDGKKPQSMHGSGVYSPATLLGKIFNRMLTQMANRPISQSLGCCSTAFRHVAAVKFKANVRTEEERLEVTWLLSSGSQTDRLGSQPSPGFHRGQWPERENIQWAAAVWRETPCWCQRTGTSPTYKVVLGKVCLIEWPVRIPWRRPNVGGGPILRYFNGGDREPNWCCASGLGLWPRRQGDPGVQDHVWPPQMSVSGGVVGL